MNSSFHSNRLDTRSKLPRQEFMSFGLVLDFSRQVRQAAKLHLHKFKPLNLAVF